MRGVILTVLLGCLAVLLRAESEPYFGSGSGDVVVISPTNGTKLVTDTTNDDGSGVDDEDGEDVTDDSLASGSGMRFTTEAPTTERETTTEETTTQETTTQETTTQEATTEEATTEETTTPEATTERQTTQPSTLPDNDDEDETGSGIFSGSTPVLPSTKPKDVSTTTDIYIETSTNDNTVIIIPTKRSTESASTPKPISFESTNPDVSTTTSTSEVPTETSTTRYVEDTTEQTTRSNVAPQTPSRDGGATEDPDDGKTTTEKIDPNVGANKGEKDDGFTLTTEVIAGVVACALLALLLIAFLMYRLKKRDEGSYLLDESNAYPEDYKKVHHSDKEAFI